MKKIAFYVEGQTEQFFINKLLIEIAGQKNIQIELQQFQGYGKPTKSIYPKTTAMPQNPQHYALIFDCVGDGGVKTRILQDFANLFSQGHSEVIGLLDLYPRTDLDRFENELAHGTQRNGRVITQPLPVNTSVIVAVREIEDWFLAEGYHFTCIDVNLTNDLIEASALGFNPLTDDLTGRSNTAADDLKSVYQLVAKSYKKKKEKVERTVECLDYANIYLNVRSRITQLNDLITKIDSFLS